MFVNEKSNVAYDVVSKIKEGMGNSGLFPTIIINEDENTPTELPGVQSIKITPDNRIQVELLALDDHQKSRDFDPNDFVEVIKSSIETLSGIVDLLMLEKNATQSKYDELVGVISLIDFQTLGVTPYDKAK